MSEQREGKDFIGVGGGVLIVDEQDRILLMKRGEGARNEVGSWSKPGGTVDYGEKVAQALQREIKEELNIDIIMVGYLPHVDHIIASENQHWVAFNYIAKIVGGELKNMEPHKCDEIAWFTTEDLPHNLTLTTKEPVANYISGKYIKI